MSIKQQVLSAIQRLPDDVNFQDVNEEIALLAAVQEAEEDIREGRTISNEEFRTRMERYA